MKKFFQRLFGLRAKKDPIEALIDEISVFKRIAFIPQIEATERAFSQVSKIGGLPYLRSNEDWPSCPNCGRHLQLFLQLDLSQLPKPVEEEGLVQLFYCTNEMDLCAQKLDAYFPFSKGVVARKIEVQGPSAQIEPNLPDLFPEKRIIGWEAKEDFPHYEELLELGMNIDERLYGKLEMEDKATPLMGDKLWGWPHWVQSPDYPFDRKTGTKMELLFQLDSEVNLPFMFGDMGIGHLTQSPDNPGELAFGWAGT